MVWAARRARSFAEGGQGLHADRNRYVEYFAHRHDLHQSQVQNAPAEVSLALHVW